MVVVSEDRPTPEQDPETLPGDTGAQPRQRLRLLLAVAATLFTLDLVTKVIVVAQLRPGESVSIVGDLVELTLVRNPGAAFSMATGMTWLLTLVATAVVIGVLRIGRTLRSTLWAVGLGGVLGGALGNLMDRLFRAPGPLQGHVVDFVSVGWWPVFNVADSSIVCGAILLVLLTVFGFEPDGTRYKDKVAAESAQAADSAEGTASSLDATSSPDTASSRDTASSDDATPAPPDTPRPDRGGPAAERADGEETAA